MKFTVIELILHDVAVQVAIWEMIRAKILNKRLISINKIEINRVINSVNLLTSDKYTIPGIQIEFIGEGGIPQNMVFPWDTFENYNFVVGD